jgi:hypothetical protein
LRQKLERAEKNIKVFVIVFHIVKVLSGNIKDIFKRPKLNVCPMFVEMF